jgi:hypothetical protein
LNAQDTPQIDQISAPIVLCEPVYSTGCSLGDGFTDFALAEIENYGSGCADLNGTGWSQYLGLGPAVLLPGFSYDVIMQTGYADQFVTIWIDFDDDEELEPEEIVLSMRYPAPIIYVPVPTGSTPAAIPAKNIPTEKRKIILS